MFTSGTGLFRSTFFFRVPVALRCRTVSEKAVRQSLCSQLLGGVRRMSSELATGKKAAAIRAVDDYVTVGAT